MSPPLKMAICGAGAWGTAMALHCARMGRQTVLVPRRREHAALLEQHDENREYLPGFPFSGGVEVTADLDRALSEADVVFLAAPSYALRDWCERIQGSADSLDLETLPFFVSLAKGLELSTRKTPCGIASEAMPGARVSSLSGPTFAGEVAAGKPTAMTLAYAPADVDMAERLQNALSGPQLRVYLCADLRGVELGGCMKNVYAVAAGCCQGLGLGDNALASLLTRAVAEMVRVGLSLGSNVETFYGLSGFGDLVATCHGEWSRNRTFGEAIARGRAASDIVASQKTAVEGYRTAKAFHDECQSKGIDAPILEQVYKICYENKPPMQALSDLMSRDLKKE